jgi:CRISPR-associated protein Cmr3
MPQLYKINLLPLGPYFFGQEEVADLGNRQMYFKRSSLFPQQSTLLGMLRHQVLLEHGLAIPVVNKIGSQRAGDLIGKGFNPGNAKGNYGTINSIGPIFLQRNRQGHHFLRDHEWVKEGKKEERELVPHSNTKKVNYRSLGHAGEMLVLQSAIESGREDYKGKQIFQEYLHDPEAGSGTRKPLSEVVQNATQVGVYKFVSRQAKQADGNEAFFKNVYQQMGERTPIKYRIGLTDRDKMYRLAHRCDMETDPEWTFAFYVEMADGAAFTEGERRVALMGKEKSTFLISIQKVDNDSPNWGSVPAVPDQLQKVLLLSDAYVEEAKLLEHSLLVNGATVRFRSFTKDYDKAKGNKWRSNLRRDQRSDSWQLLKRGSVIYTKHAGEVAELLEKAINWRQIGYNHYTILPA